MKRYVETNQLKFFFVFIGMWIVNYNLENISDNTGLSVYPGNTH